MRKRGFSHIEVIISFVIFVGFLAFAFFFFNPFQNNRVVTTTLDYAFDEVMADSSATLETYSVIWGSAVPIISIESPSSLPSQGILVTDSDGKIVDSEISPVKIITFMRPTNGKKFVNLKISEELEQGFLEGEGIVLPKSNYTFSSSSTRRVQSEGKLVLLNNTYYSNYDGLKEQFNLPARIDFGFRVDFDDGSRIEASRERPDNIEIFSERKRVEIIRKEEIVFADLIVEVW